MVFKDCKAERDCKFFSQDFKQAVQDCKELRAPDIAIAS